jgi:transketolase
MTTDRIEIDSVAEHEYLVTVEAGKESAQVQLFLDPETLSALRLDGVDEKQIIEYVIEFLARRQSVVDFPAFMYLEDVVAVYHDFPTAAGQALTR